MKKIIFMGTPEFAVPSLLALAQPPYEIKLVVTQPDRPAGRGQKLTPPPVKQEALKLGLPIFQPTSFRKEPESIQRILETECDFLVVVAFGQILPKAILDHPRVAPLNVHASVLPQYRGAAPIARSILEQETETGVSVQWMVEALDMGDVLFQIPQKIEESDTAQSLHDKLKQIGANALISTLALFERNEIIRRPQDPRIGSYAPKITKEEARLDFDRHAFQVHRKIMGLSPWPGAECRLAGERLKIYRSQFVARGPQGGPGTIMEVNESGILVACQEACVNLMELQLENRKRMAARDFIHGHSIPVGLVLGN